MIPQGPEQIITCLRQLYSLIIIIIQAFAIKFGYNKIHKRTDNFSDQLLLDMNLLWDGPKFLAMVINYKQERGHGLEPI